MCVWEWVGNLGRRLCCRIGDCGRGLGHGGLGVGTSNLPSLVRVDSRDVGF